MRALAIERREDYQIAEAEYVALEPNESLLMAETGLLSAISLTPHPFARALHG